MIGLKLKHAKVTPPYGKAKNILISSLLSCILAACTESNAPLDPKVRYQIDSLTFAQTQKAKVEIDSWCAQERAMRLPALIDSIRHQRLREIERQLKGLPR